MKKRLRRAFSIIELVIVIAIIAILAAVLIPTFANVVHKANESADVQVVRQINTLLTAENPKSSGELKQGLEANGINAENCTPIVNDTAFYWVPAENVVVYYNEGKGEVIFPERYQDLKYNEHAWLKFPVSDSTSLTVVTAGQAATVGVVADNAESTPITVNVPEGSTTATVFKLVVTDITPGGINRLEDNAAGNYAFDISLYADGVKVEGEQDTIYAVNIALSTGLTAADLKVVHDTKALTLETSGDAGTYQYNTDGTLTIYTNSFSPFSVRWNDLTGMQMQANAVSYVKDQENHGYPEGAEPQQQFKAHYKIDINFDPNKVDTKYEDMYIHWVFVFDEGTAAQCDTAMHHKLVSTDSSIIMEYISQVNSAQGEEFDCLDNSLFGETHGVKASSGLKIREWSKYLTQSAGQDGCVQIQTQSIWLSTQIKYPDGKMDTTGKVATGTFEVRLYSAPGTGGDYIVIDSFRLDTAISA